MNPPRGTIVAMVGILASCHPIPVLIILAPLSSIFLARVTISSQVEPVFTHSHNDAPSHVTKRRGKEEGGEGRKEGRKENDLYRH